MSSRSTLLWPMMSPRPRPCPCPRPRTLGHLHLHLHFPSHPILSWIIRSYGRNTRTRLLQQGSHTPHPSSHIARKLKRGNQDPRHDRRTPFTPPIHTSWTKLQLSTRASPFTIRSFPQAGHGCPVPWREWDSLGLLCCSSHFSWPMEAARPRGWEELREHSTLPLYGEPTPPSTPSINGRCGHDATTFFIA